MDIVQPKDEQQTGDVPATEEVPETTDAVVAGGDEDEETDEREPPPSITQILTLRPESLTTPAQVRRALDSIRMYVDLYEGMLKSLDDKCAQQDASHEYLDHADGPRRELDGRLNRLKAMQVAVQRRQGSLVAAPDGPAPATVTSTPGASGAVPDNRPGASPGERAQADAFPPRNDGRRVKEVDPNECVFQMPIAELLDLCSAQREATGEDREPDPTGLPSAMSAPEPRMATERGGRGEEQAPWRAMPVPAVRQAHDVRQTMAEVEQAFPRDTVALTVVRDSEHPEQRQLARLPLDEVDMRSRLAAGMAGVGGPLHRMVGDDHMSVLDVETAKGTAFGLADGSDDPVVHLESNMTAAASVAIARIFGALGQAADSPPSRENAAATYGYSRAARVLFRTFDDMAVAVEARQARVSQRTSVPEFKVCRVKLPK